MITTFIMKSFKTYAIRSIIMKTSHKILPHFFIYHMFTSNEELVQTTVYDKFGLRIYTTDLNTSTFSVLTTERCSCDDKRSY